MADSHTPFLPSNFPESHCNSRTHLDGRGGDYSSGIGFPGLKKRGHGLGNRSWIKIDGNGSLKILELDKGTLMRHCSLPARDLRLLDPMFVYPSTILGREKAIVIRLEQIRCIITADEVILMNSVDASVVHYKSELCRRLQAKKEQSDDLPFEFSALELALELTCMSLDAQVKELEMEVYPVLDELASSISTLNLEQVRRLKGHLLALTQRVQKVSDEIEHLMDDDGDMAEMYLTEKKQRNEALTNSDEQDGIENTCRAGVESISAPVSPVGSSTGMPKLHRTFSSISSTKHGSFISSSTSQENIDQLEMLLEAYFVVIDHSLHKLLSLKEYIDDTEDLINLKLGNVQNQLIQFELLLTGATFVATCFAVVTAVFGMNFNAAIFDEPKAFHWVLFISGVVCGILYLCFILYIKHKKILSL